MQYDQTVITPKGLIVHIRNGVASDGSAVLENFDLTHAETDYLLSYPGGVLFLCKKTFYIFLCPN